MLWFFVAVVMVIAATYLLFIAGSVVLCRILQKNKRYYYKGNHFVSVSSMAYRMKRNGAGLASICILLTMVLVMLSSTAALFLGMEDSLHTRYPRDIVMDAVMQRAEYTQEDTVGKFQDMVQDILDDYDAQPQNVLEYRYGYSEGVIADGVFSHDVMSLQTFSTDTYSDVVQLYLIPVSDYNQVMRMSETLEEDEVLIYTSRTSYTTDTFQIAGGETYRVKSLVDEWIPNTESTTLMIPSVVVFVSDYYKGRIQGLQIRRDNAQPRKFRWFSSVGKPDGSKAEIWTHLAATPQETVLITEGPLKADVIHQLTGQTVLAVLGANSLKHLEGVLRFLTEQGTKQIMAAFDMDYLSNPHVQIGYQNLTQMLSEFGIPFGTYLWDPQYKGLDDYIWQYCYRQEH